MLLVVTLCVSVMLNTIIATYVWLEYRPGRAAWFFLPVVATRIMLSFVTLFQQTSTSAQALRSVIAFRWAISWCFTFAMLLFLVAIYAPALLQRRNMLGGLALFYISGAIAFVIDAFVPGGIFIRDVKLISATGTQTIWTAPGLVLANVFNASWILHLSLLIRTFIRNPGDRRSLGVLLAIILFSGSTVILQQLAPAAAASVRIASDVAFVGGLGYLVTQRRIFETTKVGLEQALTSSDDGILIVDQAAKVLFANEVGQQMFALKSGSSLDGLYRQGDERARLRTALDAAPQTFAVDLAEQILNVSVNPIRDGQQRIQGYLVFARDITDVRRSSLALEKQHAELTETVRRFEQSQAVQSDLMNTIRSLSLPIIPIRGQTVVLPLIGAIDTERAVEIEQQVLESVQRLAARTVVIDMTGMPPIDSDAMQIILRTIGGVRLLGGDVIVVGIRPDIAQIMVSFSIDTDAIKTAPTLERVWDMLK